MPKELQDVVADFRKSRRGNPSDVDISTEFQHALVSSGVDTTDVNDLTEAAMEAGIPAHRLDVFLDELSSWL